MFATLAELDKPITLLDKEIKRRTNSRLAIEYLGHDAPTR